MLGERKTLCFEEAFILYVLLGMLRPRKLVEIGTQHGKSTRRLLDITAVLALDCQVVCFDQQNCVEHFTPEEAELIQRDVGGRFREEVLQAHAPDIIFHDVHTYGVLKEVVTEVLAQANPCALVLAGASAIAP